MDFLGRAAHAGLEPESGINAIVALSHWVVRLRLSFSRAGLDDIEEGTRRLGAIAAEALSVNT